ncbi:MAG TPA: hypothetical protein DE036_01595, partial [Actinobacteria bacterium]|nr:hypothetical protein [Actinomycetota bacterium]
VVSGSIPGSCVVAGGFSADTGGAGGCAIPATAKTLAGIDDSSRDNNMRIAIILALGDFLTDIDNPFLHRCFLQFLLPAIAGSELKWLE